MSKEWITYLERLTTIKRTSTDDMTQYEIVHLSGLLLSSISEENNSIWHESIFTTDVIQSIQKWLISDEENDTKAMLQSIKKSVIDRFSKEINFLLDNSIEKQFYTIKEYDDVN